MTKSLYPPILPQGSQIFLKASSSIEIHFFQEEMRWKRGKEGPSKLKSIG
jgi:hypothetical protein